MSEGYIYALHNQYLVGILKIGYTTRTPAARAKELSNTSVPTDFEWVYYAKVREPESNEARVHVKMASRNVGREFFKVTAEEAREFIREAVGGSLLFDKLKSPNRRPDDGVGEDGVPSGVHLAWAQRQIRNMDLQTPQDYEREILRASKNLEEEERRHHEGYASREKVDRAFALLWLLERRRARVVFPPTPPGPTKLEKEAWKIIGKMNCKTPNDYEKKLKEAKETEEQTSCPREKELWSVVYSELLRTAKRRFPKRNWGGF